MGEEKVKRVAYFSMEFAFNKEIPNYAGGLGVLAADMVHSAADMGVDMIGVTMLYHQDDDPEKAWDPTPFMHKRDEITDVRIEGRSVKIVIWQMDIAGRHGHTIPVFFLSTYAPENTQWDRDITKYLYANDRYTRLAQEVVLGIGGYRALKALGYDQISCYHMNEGHTALLGLERLRTNAHNYDKVRSTQTFTTHTPVPAGHDYFDYDLAYNTIGHMLPENIRELATSDRLGMTQLAMSLSHKTNSVSRRHQDVCREMFPGKDITNVTNGVYQTRWAGDHMAKLFDTHLEGWRDTPDVFSQAVEKIPDHEVEEAHKQEKDDFVTWLNEHPDFFMQDDVGYDDLFQPDVLTIGFARRFVPYKRPLLILNDINKLRKIGFKKIQLVYACNCHPEDGFCNSTMRTIHSDAQDLRGQVRIAMIPKYNIDVARKLLSGVDVWLNTPVHTREASGTSGMKAALNGVLNLSTHDGWWIEGAERAPLAGWSLEGRMGPGGEDTRDQIDGVELLEKLREVVDIYTNDPAQWNHRQKHAISLMSFFSTHRVINEYMNNIWCNFD